MEKKCRVKNCPGIIFSKKFSLCNPHYQRYRLKGDLETHMPVRKHKKLPAMKEPYYK